MIVRSVVLFVHLVGMLVLFGGLGFEWLTLRILRRSATQQQALPWVGVYAPLPRAMGIAVGLILISGIYLAARDRRAALLQHAIRRPVRDQRATSQE